MNKIFGNYFDDISNRHNGHSFIKYYRSVCVIVCSIEDYQK